MMNTTIIRTTLICLFCCLSCSLLFCSDDPVTLSDSVPLAGKIAYVGGYSEDNALFIMNPHGSNRVKLLDSENAPWGNHIEGPVMSPDGTRIAFSLSDGYVGGEFIHNREIFVMNVDGSNIIRVTDENDLSDYYGPRWSPNGSRIVFGSVDRQYEGRKYRIHIVNGDGSDLHEIWSEETDFFITIKTSWKPDGSAIIFTSQSSILVMDTDGTNITPSHFQHDDPPAVVPRYSPDGSKMLYTLTESGNQGLFVSNHDGTEERLIETNFETILNPAWGPDGFHIVFSANRFGLLQLFVINIDGTNLTQITDEIENALNPSWGIN